MLLFVNNAVTNIRVHVSLWIMVFMEYMSSSGITGSYGSFGYFPSSSAGKEFTGNAGDPGSIPESGRSIGEGIGYPHQYS